MAVSMMRMCVAGPAEEAHVPSQAQPTRTYAYARTLSHVDLTEKGVGKGGMVPRELEKLGGSQKVPKRCSRIR